MILFGLALLALLVWIYLAGFHGGFWSAGDREGGGPAPEVWPRVVAVIPARDEAEGVGETVKSLLLQDYPGPFSIVLVDDESTDGTSEVALAAAAETARADRLTVVLGAPRPPGWTGKLWAMKQGVDQADLDLPQFLLHTDADIVYTPDVLRRLVSQAVEERLALSSLMAKLRCDSFAEQALIPAFIFFFQMLYPFAWVSDPRHRLAAAAGGCMLVRREALLAVGGIEAIRGSIIDDCALARALKREGAIRLALSERVTSIRSYREMSEIRRMVVRSAYAQLRYSPILLAGTVAGLALVYLVPVLAALFGQGATALCGALAWTIMTVVFLPTLRFYRLTPLCAPLLPAIAFVYMTFTLDSAWQSWRGRGGLWKGRLQERGLAKP
jgi:hopene-associated glycosyltransferase HpnB